MVEQNLLNGNFSEYIPGTPYLILLSFFLVYASGDTIEYGVPGITPGITYPDR